MKRQTTLNHLTDAHVLALAEWADRQGVNWKSKLYAAWLVAGERVPYYTPELQQIRNKHGVAGINRVTFTALVEVRASINANRATVRS